MIKKITAITMIVLLMFTLTACTPADPYKALSKAFTNVEVTSESEFNGQIFVAMYQDGLNAQNFDITLNGKSKENKYDTTVIFLNDGLSTEVRLWGDEHIVYGKLPQDMGYLKLDIDATKEMYGVDSTELEKNEVLLENFAKTYFSKFDVKDALILDKPTSEKVVVEGKEVKAIRIEGRMTVKNYNALINEFLNEARNSEDLFNYIKASDSENKELTLSEWQTKIDEEIAKFNESIDAETDSDILKLDENLANSPIVFYIKDNNIIKVEFKLDLDIDVDGEQVEVIIIYNYDSLTSESVNESFGIRIKSESTDIDITGDFAFSNINNVADFTIEAPPEEETQDAIEFLQMMMFGGFSM